MVPASFSTHLRSSNLFLFCSKSCVYFSVISWGAREQHQEDSSSLEFPWTFVLVGQWYCLSSFPLPLATPRARHPFQIAEEREKMALDAQRTDTGCGLMSRFIAFDVTSIKAPNRRELYLIHRLTHPTDSTMYHRIIVFPPLTLTLRYLDLLRIIHIPQTQLVLIV